MKTHGRTSFRRGWPWLWYDGILNVENLNNQILVSLTRKSSGKYSPPANLLGQHGPGHGEEKPDTVEGAARTLHLHQLRAHLQLGDVHLDRGEQGVVLVCGMVRSESRNSLVNYPWKIWCSRRCRLSFFQNLTPNTLKLSFLLQKF